MCKIFNIKTGQELNLQTTDNLVLSLDDQSFTYEIIQGVPDTYNAIAAIAILEDAGYTEKKVA